MKPENGWWLPDCDNYFVGKLRARGWEIDQLETALKYVTDFNLAIDGGAHIGTWSAALAGRFAEVIAFEPASDTFDCARRNLQNHVNVRLVPAALGASRMRAAIRDDPERLGNTGSRYLTDGDAFEVYRLDDYRLEALDFLKLDLEGYEYFALLGAERTVRQCRPVLYVEVKPFATRFGLEPEAAPKLLASWGAREVERIRKDRIYVFE